MSFFQSGEFRVIVFITLGITIIAVIITLIVGLSRRPEPILVEHEQNSEKLYLSDFLLEESEIINDFSWKEARPVKESWSPEEIEFFWHDPGKAGIDQLSRENDDLIRQYFDVIP